MEYTHLASDLEDAASLGEEDRRVFLHQAQQLNEKVYANRHAWGSQKFEMDMLKLRAEIYNFQFEHCMFYILHMRESTRKDMVYAWYDDWRRMVIQLRTPPEDNPTLPALWRLILRVDEGWLRKPGYSWDDVHESAYRSRRTIGWLSDTYMCIVSEDGSGNVVTVPGHAFDINNTHNVNT